MPMTPERRAPRIRSALFIPAQRADFLEKADTRGADAALTGMIQHRDHALRLAQLRGCGREHFVDDGDMGWMDHHHSRIAEPA